MNFDIRQSDSSCRQHRHRRRHDVIRFSPRMVRLRRMIRWDRARGRLAWVSEPCLLVALRGEQSDAAARSPTTAPGIRRSGSDPSTTFSYSRAAPPRFESKTTCVPSGAHRGNRSAAGSDVNRVITLRVTSTNQMSVFRCHRHDARRRGSHPAKRRVKRIGRFNLFTRTVGGNQLGNCCLLACRGDEWRSTAPLGMSVT